MCGPHFCSMKITQEVREQMDAKAREFREQGGKI
jgi:phosphomethylpyrimidine synthase